MGQQKQLARFEEYLRSLPDGLLASLTRCYVWLAGLRFSEGKAPTGLDQRRDCCLEECLRRGGIIWNDAPPTGRPRPVPGRPVPLEPSRCQPRRRSMALPL